MDIADQIYAERIKMQILIRGYIVTGDESGFLWLRWWRVSAVADGGPTPRRVYRAKADSLSEALLRLQAKLPIA